MNYDTWIAPFLPSLRTGQGAVLELGCGPGDDAAWLITQGFSVVACDRALRSLRKAHGAAPTASLFQANLAVPLPVRSHSVHAVIASLSLHYFRWDTTRAIVVEIQRVLHPQGVLLFRVNATDDVLHGADMGEMIEPGLYRVPDQYGSASTDGRKRYFDASMVHAMLEGSFSIVALAHRTTHRYTLPKQVWECLAVSQ